MATGATTAYGAEPPPPKPVKHKRHNTAQKSEIAPAFLFVAPVLLTIAPCDRVVADKNFMALQS